MKRSYSDEEKATVVVALDANNGNVKRTSRETGVAEQTIRDWKKLAERGELKPEVVAALPAAQEAFADHAETIRSLMMDELETQVKNGDLKGRDLIVGIGVLTDKLRITRGESTSRSEVVTSGPNAEEIGAQILEYLDGAITAGQERDITIEDADWSEQAPQGELEPAQSN